MPTAGPLHSETDGAFLRYGVPPKSSKIRPGVQLV